MIKLILRITLFVFSIKTFSQQKDHVITYNVKSNRIEVPKHLKTDKKLTAKLNVFFNSNKAINFKLICNQNESVFFMDKKLKNNNFKKSLVEIILGKNYFYSNLNEQVVFNRKEALGEVFIVKQKLFNWNITNEEKKIGEYYCKKAIGIKKVINSKGVFNHKVEAWFTTEIPINFAPENYRGLPGLIIELTDNIFLYKVKKIEFNKGKYNINKPIKGKHVTYEELNNIYKQAIEDSKR